VSDVSQGPGWWQASDGKWYPPQPAAAPPPGPGPQWGGPPPAKKSNKGCFIALAVVGVIALLGIGVVVALVVAVGDEVDDRADQIERANRDGGIPTFSDNTENPPGDDVSIADCGPSDTGSMRATVDVQNHSSEPSNYIITVAFEADDGTRQLATSTALVNGLGPDQTTNTETDSFQTPPDGVDFSCAINQVQRFAA
jgi:hypothetical protein